MTKVRNLYYSTFSREYTFITPYKIDNLRSEYSDFDFKYDAYIGYSLTYKYLNIIITRRGSIQLSLMTTGKLSDSIRLMAKFSRKVNRILGINDYSVKFMFDIVSNRNL